MKDFLNLYDQDRQKIAVLQNAFDIDETQQLNNIYYMTFTIPADDLKCKLIEPFDYIRWNEKNQLYRIVKRSFEHTETDTITCESEHVISMLCNDVLYGTHTYGGGKVKTSDVINFLLSKQKKKNWVLGGCDFDRRFEYTWKHENILNALFSIPKEFDEDYMWDYDTTVYPWRLYLKKLDHTIDPEYYIRAKRNLISNTEDFDYTGIYTRIYPLGNETEDGANLTIKSVNKGVPYIQASKEYIDKYGLIEAVLIDNRFENPETLKAYAEAVLRNSVEPGVSRSFNVVDLYPLTNDPIDNVRVGSFARLTEDKTNVYITKTTRILDDPGNLSIELSTKSYKVSDYSDYIVKLAEKVQTNSVYS